jgi:hypothetical protein
VLSASEIEEVLSSGRELRALELKGPGPTTDAHLLAKVIRAALSMGNLRDGGHVIVGIADDDPAAMLPGLSEADLATWLAYDELARKIAEYADPPLRWDVAGIGLSSRATVVVIEVHEFVDIPHLCARDYGNVLRRGALYVRTRKLPETAEVGSSVEMREVVDLATTKALRAYIETAERAGVALTTRSEPDGAADDDRYAQERERAWGE